MANGDGSIGVNRVSPLDLGMQGGTGTPDFTTDLHGLH
jgi:hypothetical protein